MTPDKTLRQKVYDAYRAVLRDFALWLLLKVPAKRAADVVIGGMQNPYLLRWYILPRNRVFNIYLHQIRRSDDDRALHDHPWFNLSLILLGKYNEVTEQGSFLRQPGSVVLRSPWKRHRLETIKDAGSVWTLFITGPRMRVWGFHCPQGFVPWQEFVDPVDTGRTGRGCGE